MRVLKNNVVWTFKANQYNKHKKVYGEKLENFTEQYSLTYGIAHLKMRIVLTLNGTEIINNK